MPIKIPNDLPGRSTLESEGVFIIRENDAIRQDIRPLRIALLNLMPNKIRTETQFARLLGSTPLQLELTLLHTETYRSRNIEPEHLAAFYRSFQDIKGEKFDGFIATGAPIETLPFQEVQYWDELTEIMDWTLHNVHRSAFVCWGAQAALQHWYGVPKYRLPQKLFGIYPQRVLRRSGLLTGMDDEFLVPVSRHTEVRAEDLPEEVDVLAASDDSGLCLVEDEPHRAAYMFNHVEYDAYSLRDEYERDVRAGEKIRPPANYFPGDDPAAEPVNRWRAYAHLLFWNWIHQIYQTTPFIIEEIGSTARPSAVAPLVQTA